MRSPARDDETVTLRRGPTMAAAVLTRREQAWLGRHRDTLRALVAYVDAGGWRTETDAR